MNQKPKVFLASSAEGIHVLGGVMINLEYSIEPKKWPNAFDLSDFTLTSLYQKTKEVDFAIFIFKDDDSVLVRGEKYSTVRDNVLFELGLFMGSLGIEKCFIVIPKSLETNFKLPTDLSGLTVTSYDNSVDNMADATAICSEKIKVAIDKRFKEVIQTPETLKISSEEVQNLRSDLWRNEHELEMLQSKNTDLITSVQAFFSMNAKPATTKEIEMWEKGAKESYGKDIKISPFNIYFVDKDLIVPPGYGANSINVIVKEGVHIYETGKSHNSIYYMDGFRTNRNF